MIYKYAAIGDSLTTGIGASPGYGFVSQYRRLSRQTIGGEWLQENLGIPGATSSDIASLLKYEPDVRSIVRVANVITLTVGGNDLLRAGRSFLQDHNQGQLMRALEQCRQNLSFILHEMKSLKSSINQVYIIRLLGLYNPFPEMPEAGRWIRQLNNHLLKYRSKNIAVAPIQQVFKGKQKQYLSSDRIHPNAKGYLVIAQQLQMLGYSPLV